MKGFPTIRTAVAIALLVAGCGDAPAPLGPEAAASALQGTSPKFTDFAADEAICVLVPGDTRVVDGVLHFSGMHVETTAVGDDPRYTGTSTVELQGRRDPNTGLGRGFARFSFQPDGVDGTWEGTFTGEWTPSWVGRGVARGTGVLRGQTLHVEHVEGIVPEVDRLCPQPPTMAGPPLQFRNALRVITP